MEIPENAKNWVSLIESKALDSKAFSFNISENTNADSRECRILFKGSSLCDTLIIKQEGNTAIEFECSTFKNFLVSKYDLNGDKEISKSEALKIKDISGEDKFSSLKGIECMENLERIAIYADLIRNIDITYNKSLIILSLHNAYNLDYIDISKNASLRLLSCSGLNFSIDYSNNLALESISFTNCPEIKEIDLTSYEKLSIFHVESTPIRSIDFSSNLNLSSVYIYTTELQQLDFSNNSKLEFITITDNPFLESINLQNNNEEWLSLQIKNCPINNIDLSNCKLLWNLLLANVNLSKFDISNNYELESLQVGNIGIPLPSINLDHLKILKTLVLKTDLESIDVTKHTELENLNVGGNKLKELNVDNNKKLKYLYCFDNEISKLNLENNIALQHLECYNNKMVSLDLSKTKISYLRCSMPSLMELFIKYGEKIDGINVNRYFHPHNGNDFFYIHRDTDIKYVNTPHEDDDYVDEYGINHGKGITIDGITWAPVNCGYNESDNYSLTYGKYFQWGRYYGQRDKDMVENAPVNYSDGNMLENSHVYYNGGYETSRWDWHKSSDDKLWNNSNDNHPTKAKYDPCPQGWRVPTKEEIIMLTANHSEVLTDAKGQRGVYFTGQSSYSNNIPKVFLPLAGGVGLFGGPGNYRVDITENYGGYYWTSNASILDNWYSAYYMSINVGYYDNNVSINITQTGRSSGYSVRCVKE